MPIRGLVLAGTLLIATLVPAVAADRAKGPDRHPQPGRQDQKVTRAPRLEHYIPGKLMFLRLQRQLLDRHNQIGYKIAQGDHLEFFVLHHLNPVI